MASGDGGSAPGNCKPGFHMDWGQGGCVPNDPNFCGVGYKWDARQQKCVPDPDYKPPANQSYPPVISQPCTGLDVDRQTPSFYPNPPGTPCPAGMYTEKVPDPNWIGGSAGEQPPLVTTCWHCKPPEREDTGCCSEKAMCDGLTDILNRIAAAQEEIAKILAKKTESCSDLLSRCGEEIDKKIQDAIDKELKKFVKCQEQAAAGLCGTAEYLNNCAKYSLKCATEECYEPGVGNKPGKCSKCDKAPCCCTEGKCLPCKDEQPGNWYGWCDSVTGVWVVNQDGQNPPGPTYTQVAAGPDEETVTGLTQQRCKPGKLPPYPEPPNLPPDIPATSVTIGCNLGDYFNGANARLLSLNNADEVFKNAALRVYEGIESVGLAGLTVDNLGKIAEGFLSATFGTEATIETEAIKLASQLINCPSPEMTKIIQGLSAFGRAEKFAGVDLSPLSAPWMYALQAKCQNRFLDPDKAIAAWLAHGTEDKELAQQWAIAGYCPEALGWYKQAARAKPMPLELAAMKMRGMINETGYYEGMRQLGYTDRRDSTNLLALRQQIPTMSDIIRFMVRDADDINLVNKFGLDAGFTQKYQKQLKSWSEQQGIPENMALYAWRSHWQIPSPTQLFQFWRRLRKDQAFGGEAKLWDDIEQALIQQDILPYWHKHYQKVAYQPLGRVDIRRMLNIASIQESELEPLYQQLGYSDDDAKGLAKFAIRDRDAAIVRQRPIKLWLETLIDRNEAKNRLVNQGYPDASVEKALDSAQYDFDSSAYAAAFVGGQLTGLEFRDKLLQIGVDNAVTTKIVDKLGFRRKPGVSLKQYHIGTLDRQTAVNRLILDGMSSEAAEHYVAASDTDREATRVVNCTTAIKKQFLTGGFDKQEAENALTKAGVIQTRAVQLISDWGCEQIARGKQPAINLLCKWLERGALGPVDFLKRAKKLGYSQDDAALIMEDCLIAIDAKRNASAQKRAKEEAAAAAKEERRQLQAARQAQQLLDKAAAAQEKRRKTNDARQKQLLSATEKMLKKCDCDLSTATLYMKNWNWRLQQDYGLSKDESLMALLSAVDGWLGGDADSLTESIELAASLLQDTESSMSDDVGIILSN